MRSLVRWRFNLFKQAIRSNATASLTALSSSGGQSLIQLVIGVGIMSIMMLGMTSMIAAAHREVQFVSEKLATLELEKQMISSLADGAVCGYVLNNPAPLTFNSQAALPQTITLPSPGAGKSPALYASILPGNIPGPEIVEVGASASASVESLKVESIQLEVTEGQSGSYKGRWLVNFTQPTSGRSLKPVSVATKLTVDDVTNPAQATIGGCGGSAAMPSVDNKMVYYRAYWDLTNRCRTDPNTITKSVTGTLVSKGDILIENYDEVYLSALFEMRVWAPAATTVTQYLRILDDNVYFWLNGAKIDQDEGANQYKTHTITWNLVAGENLIQIVANNCSGGRESLYLIGDFFVRYPQLEFVP